MGERVESKCYEDYPVEDQTEVEKNRVWGQANYSLESAANGSLNGIKRVYEHASKS